MTDRIIDVALSAVVVFVAGYLLWPPRRVYWTRVADVVGTTTTMAIVFLVAGAIGAAIAGASDVEIGSLGLGASVAYVVGMVLIEAWMTPDSPVHFLLYAAFVCCMLAGATAWRRYAH